MEELTGKKVEVEVVAWMAMPLKKIENGVEWSANGQWKRRTDVDVRLMEYAELGDVDEMNASLVVEGSLWGRWDVCLDVEIENEAWMNGRPVVSETEGLDVDVEETAKGCVVVHGDDVVTWMRSATGLV